MKQTTIRTCVLMLAGFLLASCAHKDLKAPCPDKLAFGSNNIVDCNKREPINGFAFKALGE